MILLGTDVVSEPLRAAPDARVIEWLDAQALETLYVATMTVAELRAGVARTVACRQAANGVAREPGTTRAADVRWTHAPV